MKFLSLAFLTLFVGFGSTFFLPGNPSSASEDIGSDLGLLKYPKKSFIDTLFTGPEQTWKHETELDDLQYPKDSIISAFISKAFGALAQIMVSHQWIWINVKAE